MHLCDYASTVGVAKHWIALSTQGILHSLAPTCEVEFTASPGCTPSWRCDQLLFAYCDFAQERCHERKAKRKAREYNSAWNILDWFKLPLPQVPAIDRSARFYSMLLQALMRICQHLKGFQTVFHVVPITKGCPRLIQCIYICLIYGQNAARCAARRDGRQRRTAARMPRSAAGVA
eukprot:5803209-Pleurochrysis_carterae.AAC.7